VSSAPTKSCIGSRYFFCAEQDVRELHEIVKSGGTDLDPLQEFSELLRAQLRSLALLRGTTQFAPMPHACPKHAGRDAGCVTAFECFCARFLDLTPGCAASCRNSDKLLPTI
jgi:hypothetical protein